MSRIEFENDGNSKKYKLKAIHNRAIYVRESKGYLPGLYYFVFWKNFPEEKNAWELVLTVLYLYKFINIFHFHHDYPKKPIAISSTIDSALPTVRPIVRPIEISSTKQKRSWPAKANGTSKHAKKSCTSSFLFRFWLCLNSKQKTPQSRNLPLRSLIFRFSPTFWFFFLGIGQEIFSTNYLDLSVFFHQSPKGLEVSHQLIYQFFPPSPTKILEVFHLQLCSSSTYTLVRACVLREVNYNDVVI